VGNFSAANCKNYDVRAELVDEFVLDVFSQFVNTLSHCARVTRWSRQRRRAETDDVISFIAFPTSGRVLSCWCTQLRQSLPATIVYL